MSHETILISLGLVMYGAASIVAVFSLLRPLAKGGVITATLMSLGLIPLLVAWVERVLQRGAILPIERFESLTFYALVMTGAYFGMIRRRETRLLAGLLAPLVTVVLIMGEPLFITEHDVPDVVHSVWLGVHVVTALFSYAIFSLAAVLAAAYLRQDRNLKQKKLDGLFTRLPSLETLDHHMSWQVGLAFSGLTVAMLIGVLLVRMSGGGEEWITDPKIIATSTTWAVYAVLVHLRAIMGRRGRSLAVICIIGAICMFFAFVGVNLFAPGLHGDASLLGEITP